MNIPKFAWDSPEAADRIKLSQPVILSDCPLSQAVSGTWDFEYLSNIITSDFNCDVYTSVNKSFQYWDTAKNSQGYEFEPPTSKQSMAFRKFVELSKAAGPTEYYYLQQSMVEEMGPMVMQEYKKFPLEIALRYKLVGDWDGLTTNLLLCGNEGAVTPLHFDEQQNLFAQLHGRKRVRLFSPQAWLKLYPFPVGHPCDRQTRVTLSPNPGVTQLTCPNQQSLFPEFQNQPSTEYYVDLDPGDVLYIPQYWFHQMEALTDNISMSWWFKQSTRNVDPANIDFSKVSFIAIRRNLEKLIDDMCKEAGGREQAQLGHMFFLAVAGGLLELPCCDANGVTCTDMKPLLATDIAAAAWEVGAANVRPEWAAILAEAVQLATIVLPAGQAPSFIQSLVAGRFSCLNSTSHITDTPLRLHH